MSNTNVVRNELSKYAQQIENLARKVQDTLAQGGDPISVANEMVRNSSTFVFVLGEMYALENKSGKTAKAVKGTTVSNPNSTPRNYHNVRDSQGRFSKV